MLRSIELDISIILCYDYIVTHYDNIGITEKPKTKVISL